METKIIKVVFGGRRYAVTNKRTRTDYGQMFEFVDIDLPETFEVIFSNSSTSSGTGKKMIGSNQRCLIPDEYLKTGQPIYAWVLVHDGEDDGRHMYSIKSPVDDMPDTSPEEPTPVEQSVISQAITALNTAVDTTTQKAQEASASADRAEHAAEGAEGYAERAEAAQSASESARDIALEAKVSAQASAATASEKASEAISSATTASQSAITAENASESAQGYASASAESASQASQSADIASGKASDASEYASNANTSAQTASQKASEASQSASTAVQAKTDAETAKQASQTAQGLAESARDGAVTAQESAESARDEAQDIVDGITNKIEQIDSNTTRIESLEDDRYKPYPTDTASGSIASFPDGADDIPLKSCIVHVEPVQAGSGDPSPENERPITGWEGMDIRHDGKNLLDPSLLKDQVAWNIIPIYAPVGTVLTMSTNQTNNVTSGLLTYFRTPGGAQGSAENVLDTHSVTKTVGEEGYLEVVQRNRDNIKSYADYEYQIEVGSTATDYEPYTGHTYPITFPTETGTVYGAYIDVTGGELVVDRAELSITKVAGKSGTWETSAGNGAYYYIGGMPTINRSNDGVIVDRLTTHHNVGVTAPVGKLCFYGTGIIRWTDSDEAMQMELDNYRAYLAEHPIKLTYRLTEPIHYPLTPIEIKTLLGQNNIWSDCGDTEVEYRADVTKYIDRKITEAVSALT